MKFIIQGLGEVPSFKNTKQIIRPKNRRAMLITAPRKRAWMDQASALLECQLRSCIPASGIPTLTGAPLLYAIASLLPLDDSRKWIATLNVAWRPVSKGLEGAEIEIIPLKL